MNNKIIIKVLLFLLFICSIVIFVQYKEKESIIFYHNHEIYNKDITIKKMEKIIHEKDSIIDNGIIKLQKEIQNLK